MAKPGRNDPCYCGSGKKYKQCHLQIDLAKEREEREQGEAARFLRIELPRFARNERFAAEFDKALPIYWDNYYEASNAGEMSEFEALRFLDWFVFDHRLEDGSRILDIYAEEFADSLTPMQRSLLESWQEAGPASGYELRDYQGQTLELQDVFSEEQFSVYEASGRGNVEIGEVILIRLVPVFDQIEFSTVAAYLPGEESNGLVPYMQAAQEAQQDADSSQTLAEFVDENSHLIIHYALQKAQEAGRPPVSRLDPQRTDEPIQSGAHEYDHDRVHRQRTYGKTVPHMAQTRRKAV
ncbi:MAG: YecA family protein [Candidatus Promineifilaceae bacterium]